MEEWAAQPQGLFITFEGIDGSGKTTQAQALHGHLQAEGIPSLLTLEPGGTTFGEMIRELLKRASVLRGVSRRLLLSERWGEVNARAELLLFEAARAQLVGEVLRPHLRRGEVVVCDRFIDSTMAYQGYGRGLGLNLIEQANLIATDGLRPDLTFLLDLAPEMALCRKGAPGAGKPSRDRIEREELSFHRRVREGYLKLAAAEPERFLVLDGSLPIATLEERVWDQVKPKLATRSLYEPA